MYNRGFVRESRNIIYGSRSHKSKKIIATNQALLREEETKGESI